LSRRAKPYSIERIVVGVGEAEIPGAISSRLLVLRNRPSPR